ncbi:peroxiredoxin family protein [Winogradskyella aurantiaca]|uniref:peroxiredoxin family protein n=1 Tax=Winogradskyella aurantiaca TaxID=2219558 RepID=UPI000E1E28E5|nr:TlpA disulfide reductase family protein [Winogradskyella aurantiaca]
MRHSLLYAIILMLVLSCKDQPNSPVLKQGVYRAVLTVQDNEELPFIFKVIDESHLEIYNAEEVITVDQVTYKNDSVYIQAPVFEGFIAAAINESGDLSGHFTKESLDRVVSFYADYGNTNRFGAGEANTDVSGVWEVVFSEGMEGDEYMAKGIFQQDGNKVTGTFRTTTGDYRYLEGVMDNQTMRVSAFDGAHAFVFVAEVTDSTMKGQFYSGNHWKEPFIAKRNPNYELPSADSLTFLKEGYDTLEFEFPDSEGNIISLSNPEFEGKVVVVQVMGTWCPNCLDESKYYTQFYKANQDAGFEIVALAFEYAKTKEKAFQGIERLQKRLQIDYPILLAQYGSSDKGKANEKLPMLNHVLSYPTSIFIDKQGRVRKIHTGFNGPATGDKYLEFKQEFEGFVAELLAE